VRVTADALNILLDRMQALEDMRRTIRDIRDANHLTRTNDADAAIRPIRRYTR